MPGLEKSAPKVARPVTLSSPSGLLVRFPIHLLFEPFAVIAALSSIRRFCSVASVPSFLLRQPPQPPTSQKCNVFASIANPSRPGSLQYLAAILQGTARWTTALARCPVCRDGAAGTGVLQFLLRTRPMALYIGPYIGPVHWFGTLAVRVSVLVLSRLTGLAAPSFNGRSRTAPSGAPTSCSTSTA